jgi:hypothetical protein
VVTASLHIVTDSNPPMDNWFTGPESNMRPHEYEASVLNTRPTFGTERTIELRFKKAVLYNTITVVPTMKYYVTASFS